jgi:hypothetical protein
MDDLEATGNLFEAALWFVVAVLLLIKARRTADPDVRRVLFVLAPAFLVFGVTDLIESRTGAWWRPFWLPVIKGSCALTFLWGFRKYYVFKKQSRDS